MERKHAIIIGVAAGVLFIGGVVGVVLVRRASLEDEGSAANPSAQGQQSRPAPGGSVVTPPTSGSASESPYGEEVIPGGAFGDPKLPGPFENIPPQPNTVDRDGDGISDEQEAQLGTDPQNIDSDGDGQTDGAEFYDQKTDPKTKNPPPPRG